MVSIALRFGCIATLFTALAVGVRADAPVELRFHPAKGSVIHLKATFDQKLTQGRDTGTTTMNQSLSLGYTFTAQEIGADGTVTLKVTYDSVSFSQKSAAGDIEYDSQKPPPTIHPLAKAFVDLPGQSITIDVKPDGHVTAVHGAPEMIDAILTKLDLPEGEEKKSVENTLRAEYSEKAVKDDMETMLLIYPDHPVSTGDHWVRHMDIAKVVPMTLDNTFTLNEITDGVATLGVKSTLATSPTTAPISLGTHELRYHLSGEQTGTIKLNMQDGVCRSATITQHVSGDILMTDAADKSTTKPAPMPLSIETNITMESK